MRMRTSVTVVIALAFAFLAGPVLAQDEAQTEVQGRDNDVRLNQRLPRNPGNQADITVNGNQNLLRNWQQAQGEACCSRNAVGDKKAFQDKGTRLELSVEGNANRIGLRQVRSRATVDVHGSSNEVLLNQEASRWWHKASIDIEGDSNYGEIIQEKDIAPGGGKKARLTIDGRSNLAQICQTGLDHTARALLQGTNNTVMVKQ